MANKFVPWIDSPVAGETTQAQATFASDEQRTGGFVAGKTASAIRVNSALRQANVVVSALMQLADDLVTLPELDLNSSVANITAALKASIIDPIETRLSDLDDEVAALSGGSSTLGKRVTALESEMNAVELKNTQQDSSINELASALNGKANTSGTYPNMTVGKATADASGNVIPDTYALLPTSVTDTGRASGQWVVGTGSTPGVGKTMLLGTFNIYDTNIWLHISGGFARGGSSNDTTDVNVFISSLQGTVNETYCYVRKLYKSDRTQGIYYTVDSSKNLRIYAAVPQFGKMFVFAEVSGGSIVDKGSDEDVTPSGGQYIPEKNYADLGQVVRKDVLVGAISPVSDAGKNWLANKRLLTSGKQINASGWYRIAEIPNYCKAKFNIFKQYNYDVGESTTITINSGIANWNYVLINVESSMMSDGSDNYVKQVRFSNNVSNTSGYVDVYIEAAELNTYWLSVDACYVYNSNFEIYAFESVTEAVTANTTIVDVPTNGGSNTNKLIYQQGEPVLVGDQSAIFESDGTTVKNAAKAAADKNGNPLFATDPTKLVASVENGWTEITSKDALPSAGVYLIKTNYDTSHSEDGAQYYSMMAFDGESQTSMTAGTLDSLSAAKCYTFVYYPLGYPEGGAIGGVKWFIIRFNHELNDWVFSPISPTMTKILYKRIV